MRIRTVILLTILFAAGIFSVNLVAGKVRPVSRRKLEENMMESDASPIMVDSMGPPGAYVLVGGQNGTWFGPGQYPRLNQVSFETNSSTALEPVRSDGTVWGGGFNGSQWLVSGWGSDDDSYGPYVWLYNGATVVTEGSLDQYGQASSWSGGDVFAASYNGKEWLLSGLGSGVLPSYNPNQSTNHMSLGTFNGTSFTDLSNLVPEQQDAILYTNAWNGKYWLVGGGYWSPVLFTFDGHTIVDLTLQAEKAISNFGSVQAVAWNGNYWLIGGIGFLAKYDGRSFVDLTQELENAVSTNFYSVNAIAWNGNSWLMGGGTPIAVVDQNKAWIASYTPSGFTNLSPALPSYVSGNTGNSSILTITTICGTWILGGYVNNRGLLLVYDGTSIIDYSGLVKGLRYVDWVSSPYSFLGCRRLVSQPAGTHLTVTGLSDVPIVSMLLIASWTEPSSPRRIARALPGPLER